MSSDDRDLPEAYLTTLADFDAEVKALFETAERIAPDSARVWSAEVAKTPAETLSAFIGYARRLADMAETTDPTEKEKSPEPGASSLDALDELDKAADQPPLFPGFPWEEASALDLAFEDDFSHEDWPALITLGKEAAAAVSLTLASALGGTGRVPESAGEPRTGALSLTLVAWLTDFSRHRADMGLADAKEDDPLRLFLIDFTRRRRASLLAWLEAVEAADRKPPHALWWY